MQSFNQTRVTHKQHHEYITALSPHTDVIVSPPPRKAIKVQWKVFCHHLLTLTSKTLILKSVTSFLLWKTKGDILNVLVDTMRVNGVQTTLTTHISRMDDIGWLFNHLLQFRHGNLHK